MGRRSIPIQTISEERRRHVTFNKRKSGLMKKAMELSILCNSDILLIIFDENGQLNEYCTNEDPRPLLRKYFSMAHFDHDRICNNDYEELYGGEDGKKKTAHKKTEYPKRRNPPFLPMENGGVKGFQTNGQIPDPKKFGSGNQYFLNGTHVEKKVPTQSTGFTPIPTGESYSFPQFPGNFHSAPPKPVPTLKIPVGIHPKKKYLEEVHKPSKMIMIPQNENPQMQQIPAIPPPIPSGPSQHQHQHQHRQVIPAHPQQRQVVPQVPDPHNALQVIGGEEEGVVEEEDGGEIEDESDNGRKIGDMGDAVLSELLDGEHEDFKENN